MVQLMPLYPQTPSSLASLKSRLVLPFWFWLTQVVLEKRPLNGCSSSSYRDVWLVFRLAVYTLSISMSVMGFIQCIVADQCTVYATRTRNEIFSGHDENCPRNMSDLADIASFRPDTVVKMWVIAGCVWVAVLHLVALSDRLSVCLSVTGQFEALCPGGYGYVRQTRGDKIEGAHIIACCNIFF